jgi:hypothetical protein
MAMDLASDHSSPPRSESAIERESRVRHEAEMIAQGHADIAAGLGIEDDALEDWLDALDRNGDIPFPSPGGSAPHR